MASDNGKPSPGIGIVIAALVVGGVIGFGIGHRGGGGGGTVPTPAPTPTTTPTPRVGPTLTYDSGKGCLGPNTKNVFVGLDGKNSCKDPATNPKGDVDVYPALNGQTVNWNSDSGTTLVIVFTTPSASKAFPNFKGCYANACTIGVAEPTYHLTPQEYAAYVYGRNTPTPAPGGPPTPTPAFERLGRIIIRP